MAEKELGRNEEVVTKDFQERMEVKSTFQDIQNVAAMLPHSGINDAWPMATATEIVSLSGQIKGMSIPRIMRELQNIETMMQSSSLVGNRQDCWEQAIQILKIEYSMIKLSHLMDKKCQD